MNQHWVYNSQTGKKTIKIRRKEPGYLMKKQRYFMHAVIGCVLLFPLADALAQGPPINTDTPIMLGIQGRGIRTFGRIIRKSKLLKEGDEIPDSLNRVITAWVTPVAIPYNFLSDKLQFGVIIPYVNINLDKSTGDISSSGIGDVRLFAKVLLFQHDSKNKTVRVASKAGIKLPTGDENNRPALGTGTTDYFFSTVAGWIEKRVGVYVEGIYNVKSTQGSVDFGNSFSYNLALAFRFFPAVYEIYPSPQITGYLELNGTTVDKNEVIGIEDNNSGGTTLFLSPGLQYTVGRHWLVETSFQYPIINEPNGTQLATDWTISFGTRVLMF